MNLDKAILRSVDQTTRAASKHKLVYCPLCKTQRKLRYRSNLSPLNYLQIIFVSGLLGYFLFPIMREKVVFMLFIVWMGFETINKALFRKEVPCPDCGFDATWYRKDVKVARKKVEEFWQANSQQSANQQSTNQQSTKTIAIPKVSTKNVSTQSIMSSQN